MDEKQQKKIIFENLDSNGIDFEANLEKDIINNNIDNLSENNDIKIFNGLIKDNKIVKKLNIKKNTNNLKEKTKDQKSREKDLDSYLNNNNTIPDLNFISFGDANLLFGNNLSNLNEEEKNKIIVNKNIINNKKKKKTKSLRDNIIKINNATNNINNNENDNKINLQSDEKKENKKIKYNNTNSISNKKEENKYSNVPENLFMTTDGYLGENDEEQEEHDLNSKENIIFNPFIVQKEKNLNVNKNTNINFNNNNIQNNMDIKPERKYSESINTFRIVFIKEGTALLITEDDVVFPFPAILLPRGAKIGENFVLEIKSLDTTFIYKNKKADEINEIQKKFMTNDINIENNQKNDVNKEV